MSAAKVSNFFFWFTTVFCSKFVWSQLLGFETQILLRTSKFYHFWTRFQNIKKIDCSKIFSRDFCGFELFSLNFFCYIFLEKLFSRVSWTWKLCIFETRILRRKMSFIWNLPWRFSRFSGSLRTVWKSSKNNFGKSEEKSTFHFLWKWPQVFPTEAIVKQKKFNETFFFCSWRFPRNSRCSEKFTSENCVLACNFTLYHSWFGYFLNSLPWFNVKISQF